MQVRFINNEGGGLADDVECQEGCKIGTFLAARLSRATSEYTVRVNRNLVTEEHVLQDGDQVSAVPRKIEGA